VCAEGREEVYGQCILSGADAAALCGNGNLDKESAGEQCDAGSDPEKGNSDTAPNRCRSNCSSPSCGDGVTDDASKEQCDAGDFNSNLEPDRCRDNCTLPVCGDQVIDTAQPFNEQCDEGKGNSPAKERAKPNLCRSNCLCPVCGDGIVDSTPIGQCTRISVKEACDDGEANSDKANARCRAEKGGKCQLARCGDGVVDSGIEGQDPPGVRGHKKEECDLGVENSDDSNAICRSVTSSWACQYAKCGDNVWDPGVNGQPPPGDPTKPHEPEECDGTALGVCYSITQKCDADCRCRNL